MSSSSSSPTATTVTTTTMAMKKACTTVRQVEDTVARISSNPRVLAVMILSMDGSILLQSTWPPELQSQHAEAIIHICQSASSLLLLGGGQDKSNSPDDDDALSFITIRSKQREILVSTEGEYILVVLQNPLIHATE